MKCPDCKHNLKKQWKSNCYGMGKVEKNYKFQCMVCGYSTDEK
jgi:hypothetical protein